MISASCWAFTTRFVRLAGYRDTYFHCRRGSPIRLAWRFCSSIRCPPCSSRYQLLRWNRFRQVPRVYTIYGLGGWIVRVFLGRGIGQGLLGDVPPVQ